MKTRLVTLLMFAAAATVGSLGDGQDRPSGRAPQQAVVPLSQVFLIDDVPLPALDDGPLVELNVEDGDEVEAGAVLARLDDARIRMEKQTAELDQAAAQARADDDIEVRFAVKSLELAELELEQDIAINRRSPGAVPDSRIRRQELTKHRAELEVLRTELDQRIAGMTAQSESLKVMQVDQRIRQRQIVAPFSGTVSDVLKQKSEWVSAGEPVMRLIRMNRLRVDGLLSLADFQPSEIADRPVIVEARLARGRVERFRGRVVFTSRTVQGGNKFRVRAEVDNRLENGHWLLMPGMSTSMIIQLD